jgi:hypothetical protein
MANLMEFEVEGSGGLKVSVVLAKVEGLKQVSNLATACDLLVEGSAIRVLGAYVDLKASLESALEAL